MIRFLIETFYCGIFSIYQCDYNVAIYCGILLSHNEKIPFVNSRINHAVASHGENE